MAVQKIVIVRWLNEAKVGQGLETGLKLPDVPAALP